MTVHARSKPLSRVEAVSLTKEVRSVVDQSAAILSDESYDYRYLGQIYDSGHHTVNPGNFESARRPPNGFSDNINSAESFFSLVKWGHYGVYHQMSKGNIFTATVRGV